MGMGGAMGMGGPMGGSAMGGPTGSAIGGVDGMSQRSNAEQRYPLRPLSDESFAKDYRFTIEWIVAIDKPEIARRSEGEPEAAPAPKPAPVAIPEQAQQTPAHREEVSS